MEKKSERQFAYCVVSYFCFYLPILLLIDETKTQKLFQSISFWRERSQKYPIFGPLDARIFLQYTLGATSCKFISFFPHLLGNYHVLWVRYLDAFRLVEAWICFAVKSSIQVLRFRFYRTLVTRWFSLLIRPGNWQYLEIKAMGVLAIFIAVGFQYRMCTILYFLMFSHLFLLEMTLYLNHYYLVSFLNS